MEKNVEIVCVIDVSAYMETAMRGIVDFIMELPEALDEGVRNFAYVSGFSNIRIKIITFSDVSCETIQSRWFNVKCSKNKYDSINKKLIMPSRLSFPEYERTEFKRFVRSNIRINVGTAQFFNGLEALSKAVQTDWTIPNNTFDCKCRYTIFFITLNGVNHRNNSELINYKCRENISYRFNELSNIWLNRRHNSNNSTKVPKNLNLVMFAPGTYPWVSIYELWDSVAFFPVESAQIFDSYIIEDLLNFCFCRCVTFQAYHVNKCNEERISNYISYF